MIKLSHTHVRRECPLKLVYILCHTHSHSPLLLQFQHFGHNGTWSDVVNIHKYVCAEEGKRRQRWEGEKWVPCVERWTATPVLWPVKGIWLNVWGDMDVPEHRWGERAVRGQVLILKHGCLSWSRPTVTAAPLVICLRHSYQMRLESRAHTPPPWWPQGPWGWTFAQDVQLTQDWLEPCFFISTHFFSSPKHFLLLSQCLCLFRLVPLPPKKPQECCMAARKKKGHASFTVSPSLSAVPE